MKFQMSRLVVLPLLLLCFSAVAMAGEKKFEKKFNASPGGSIVVETDIGDVSIEGTSGNEVSIVAVVRGSGKFLSDFNITAEQQGSEVRVKGDMNRSLRHWWNDDNDVRYTISVPRKYNLDISTAGGDIRISKLEGKALCETAGGDVEALDVNGDITLSTSGGDVSGRDLRGKIAFETSGGDIEISNAKGSVEASTSGGDIRIAEVEGKVNAETSGGDVVVRVASSMNGVHAETMGGDVEIVVPRTVAANIDASTFGGEVTCDLPITLSGKISESSVKGTVNGGGETIHARTMGGNIRIRSK